MALPRRAMAELEVNKRLCFEDVSMHSPEVFSRFEAQRARDEPSVDGLRRCARPPPHATHAAHAARASNAAAAAAAQAHVRGRALTWRAAARSVLGELARTTERYGCVMAEAEAKAAGHSEADLKRLKYAVTNLKGGVTELAAHARFVAGARGCEALASPGGFALRAADARPAWLRRRSREREHHAGGGGGGAQWGPGAPRSAQTRGSAPASMLLTAQPPVQLSEEVKKQKAELDALRADVEQRCARVAAAAAAFDAEHARVSAQLASAPAPPAGRAALSPLPEAEESVVRVRTRARAGHRFSAAADARLRRFAG